jgi:hypothetical protein
MYYIRRIPSALPIIILAEHFDKAGGNIFENKFSK